MSSPSIAPDPRRLAQAHAAGLRPTSRWLRLSAHAVVIVLLAPWAIATVTADLGQCWRGAMDTGAGAGAVECSLPGLAAVVGALLLAVALAELAVASLTGRAGQLDRARRGRLGRVGSWREHGGAAHLVLALLVGALLYALLGAGLVAGAARAVDAGTEGLAALWSGWWSRALVVTALALAAAGLAERHLSARARWSALHQTFEERAAQLRERGGR